MLTLNHVTFHYPGRRSKGKAALQDVSLTFQPGVFYAVYGPSGSGKTTCLSLLGGLDAPTEGTVELDGVSVQSIGGNKLRRGTVAYIFQDFKLFPYMTALENVLAALQIAQPKLDKAAAQRKAANTLATLGLTQEEQNRRAARLSGGEQQRVAIARALVTDATYLLADEPTGNLDSDNAQRIVEILRSLVEEQGKCVIVVTHSEEVRDAADCCYALRNGRVAEVSGLGTTT